MSLKIAYNAFPVAYPVAPSPYACENYCSMMDANCKDAYKVFPTAQGIGCMTACGNYSVAASDETYVGDNLQCRQHHVEYAAAQNSPQTHCSHVNAACNCFPSKKECCAQCLSLN